MTDRAPRENNDLHLAIGRVQRGLARQWPLILFTMFVISAVGVASDIVEWPSLALARAALIWAGAGMAVALFTALVLELARNTITAPSSLQKHRGYTVFGATPELTAQALRTLPPEKRTPLGCLAFDPGSPFASAFRDLQHAIHRDCVVAFVGAWPRDGATTVALCTAISAAQQGRKAIVLDCDLRRRSLTRRLGASPEAGLLEACAEPQAWSRYVEEEEETGLHYLPAARVLNPWRTLVGAAGFTELIAQLRQCYDLIVLDCPPVLNAADSGIITGLADRSVMVAAWDHTPMGAVRTAVRVVRRYSRADNGFCVNRVPPGYRFVAK